MPQAHRLPAPLCRLGEGPRWFQDRVWWVDILSGILFDAEPDGADLRTRALGDSVSFVLPRDGGGLVAGVGREVVLFDSHLSVEATVHIARAGSRTNDAACDAQGNLWVGTMDQGGEARVGTLVCVTPSLTTRVLLDGLGIPNGIAFDDARGRIYFIDSLDRRVDLLHTRGPGLLRRSVFCAIEGGLPDGIALDQRGDVWVAVHGGSEVRRFDATGVARGVIPLPVSQVTACGFGGPDRDRLYVTTAREGLTAAESRRQPEAGATFYIDGAARGVPIHAFGG